MGKSTVVSVLPFVLTEEKPGLNPSYYEIPSAKEKGLAVLVVKDGFHNVLIPYSDDKAPPMRVTDTSERIAESLILDYVTSCLAVDYETGALPGLFWLDGEISEAQIKISYTKRLEQAVTGTKLWFQRLVKLADDDWQKYHQHRSITDLQRSACSYLNMTREWNFDVMTEGNRLCWGCKAAVHPAAIVCGNCKAIINMEEYQKNKDRFVQNSN